jgi:hypothetical protein
MEITKQQYIMRASDYMEGLEDLIGYINKVFPTKNMNMIEIGSYAGESTELFSKHFNKVIAIDPFINDYDSNDLTCNYLPLTEVYNIFTNVIDKYDNIVHIRHTSDDAIIQLKETQVDFVYIDGLHTYEQIKKDIANYLPLIVQGGFIGGHDYHPVWQGVINGVNETIGAPEITFKDTSWLKQLK